MGQVFPGRRGYNINNAYGHDGLKHSKIQGSYKANARELRTQQEARDRELDARRQLDDAYARETERERRTFDDAHQEAYAQFRDCMQQGRSDLEESAAHSVNRLLHSRLSCRFSQLLLPLPRCRLQILIPLRLLTCLD